MKNDNKFLIEFYKALMDIHNEHVALFLAGKQIGLKNAIPKTAKAFEILGQFFGERELGDIKILKHDFKSGKFVFKLENSVFKTGKRKPSCVAASGILAGFFESAYKQYTGANETKCVCKGDKYCEIEVKVLDR